jgi:hypothetical protein
VYDPIITTSKGIEMTTTTTGGGAPGLFKRLHSKTVTKKDLQEAAQLAIRVEFTTIPAYLTALYSMAETDCTAYQALRSVVMEEMFHVNQASNVLVALGGTPRFTGPYTPTYPNYLPHANPDTTPMVGLNQASTAVFGGVFAAIETPAAPGAPPEGDNYDTISQLYHGFLAAVTAYEAQTGENPFNPHPATGRQRTDIYIGKFGGKVIEVGDTKSALAAVNEIIQQGEGTVPVDGPLVPFESHGIYNHYGQRTDGTYGPIQGTPYEMSHFIKFRNVSLDTANFPATLPVVTDGTIADYTNEAAKLEAKAFDQCYSVMLHALEQCFAPAAVGAHDPYFGIVLTLMHQVLPNLARALMNTPAKTNGDPDVGPNASPTWQWAEGAKLKHASTEIDKALKLLPARSDAIPLLQAAQAAIASLGAKFGTLGL